MHIHTPADSVASHGRRFVCRLWVACFASLLALAAFGWGVSRASAQPPVVESKVNVSVLAQRSTVVAGDQFALAVVLDHAPGWHTQTNAPEVPEQFKDFAPIATTITLAAPTGISAGPIQWPAPKRYRVGFFGEPVEMDFFSGKAVAFVPVRLAASVPAGVVELPITVGFQACDDTTCEIPQEVKVTVRLTIAAPGTTPPPDASADPVFAGFDPRVFAEWSSGQPSQPASARSQPLAFNVFGWSFTIDPRGAGFALLLIVAFVGGFILNLTPCVLPVIPIKILGLSQVAGNPARCFLLGAVMSLGVVAFWLVIGGVIALSTGFKSAAELVSYWWFSMGIGVFILFMGLGMLGAFTVGLPQWIYAINPKQESASGSFLFGVLTAVLSTPCVAPFMGTAVGWAAFQPAPTTLATFGAVGLGMAFPYLVLSARPAWIDWVPRAGPASELVKQVMGLLMLAVAVFFVGTSMLSLVAERPYLATVLYWWVVGAVCVVTAAWMTVRTWAITPHPLRRVVFTALAALIAILPLLWASHMTSIARSASGEASAGGGKGTSGFWTLYTPEVLQAARASGNVVVVEFTAEWCLNCKALEATVLNTETVRAALTAPGVSAIKVDLTSRTSPGWELLREYGEAGIPLLAISGPGFPEIRKSNAYTAQWVVETVAAARPATRPAASASRP